MIKITYFTPTYNRAYLLPQLYKALCEQTNKSFVWLIIDDGSTDTTEELIKGFIDEGEIQIEYHKKPNGGKHTAIDLSNQVCKTQYISCIDSDDYPSKNSTEILLKYIEKYNEEDSVGFVGRRGHYDGVPFSYNWPERSELIYFKDLNYKYNYTADTALIFKTDIIKNFTFPIFEDERFVTESVFYNQFMHDYKIRTIEEIVYLAEYQEDGYTSQGMRLFFKNPKGFVYSLNQDAYYLIKSKVGLVKSVKKVASYFAWKKVLKVKIKEDYKLPLFHRICGHFIKFILVGKYNKEYKNFQNKN